MSRAVAITGIGMITPLGKTAPEVWARLARGETAHAPPGSFDASAFACPWCAEVKDFQPELYTREPKMLRLMNRDSQLAVAAAHLALADAELRIGIDYPPEAVALFGATGTAGMPLGEIGGLIRSSVSPAGQFDPVRFGRDGLRAINPLLSFKILSNMPVCFVSISENIQGPNAIYTPWEGQGAQAIDAGRRAILRGEVPCALVGGCDVKTHDQAFLTLEQQGWFEPWNQGRTGPVPGEGAVFLVLEAEEQAQARGARCHARLAGRGFATHFPGESLPDACAAALRQALGTPPHVSRILISAADGNAAAEWAEASALASLPGPPAETVIRPKRQAGNLFAAAAAFQVGLGAWLAGQEQCRVQGHCFGHGSEQAAFILEAP